MTDRSFVIPVLSLGQGARYNILTLLEDLRGIGGEVICIFNNRDAFERLQNHPRIDKYCFNKTNAGVSRSWNMGINLAEGATVFILNEDLRRCRVGGAPGIVSRFYESENHPVF